MSHPFIEQARQCIGQTYVLDTPRDMEPYVQAARYGCGQALAVLRPGSTTEVSQLMRIAHQHNLRIIPQGSHTSLTLSATPQDATRDIVLSTTRLRDIFELDPLERTLRLSSGYKLSEINERLAQHRLWFPIDLAADPTVGGMLGTNTGGTRLVRYGDVRSNTLGLSIVLAEPAGELVAWHNGLAKNNTGIDGKQLFIGSSGAFGIITEAVLRVHPLPLQRAVALIAPTSEDAIMPLFQIIQTQFHDVLSAFEGMSRHAVELALQYIPNLRAPFQSLPDYMLLVELSTTLSQNMLPLADTLEQFLADQFETTIADAIVGSEESLWSLRHSISEGLREHGEIIGFDIALKRADFSAFKADAHGILETQFPGIEIADFGHIGDGGMHFNLVWPKSLGALSDTTKQTIRRHIYDLVVHQYNGSFSAEHGIGPYLQTHYDLYTPQPIKDFATRLEKAFDPYHLLSVTRFGNKDQ